jgi:hypothetical protein
MRRTKQQQQTKNPTNDKAANRKTTSFFAAFKTKEENNSKSGRHKSKTDANKLGRELLKIILKPIKFTFQGG